MPKLFGRFPSRIGAGLLSDEKRTALFFSKAALVLLVSRLNEHFVSCILYVVVQESETNLAVFHSFRC